MSTGMDIDRPLDEIIDRKRAERKSSRGRGGRGGRGAGGRGGARGGAAAPAAAGTGPVRNRYSGNIAASNGAGVVSPTAAASVAAAAGQPVVPRMADGSKILVSNLPQDVTENQIRELFTQTVGPVTRINISYDRNGKSTGQASIELRRPGDGEVALKQYNGRLIDGTRPMKVEVVFDPTRLPPPPLSSRVAPAPIAAPKAPAAIAAR